MQQHRRVPIARFRRLLGVALTAYWMALFVSTHTPIPKGMLPPQVSDKTLHFVAYFGLAYLLALWCSTKSPLTGKRAVALFLLLLAYGAADELLQLAVNRNADVYDWLADISGAAAGLAGLRLTRTLCPQLWCARDGTRG